jgi:hypothetical protein
MRELDLAVIEKTQTRDWFGVDSTGWRRLNAGRKMGHLIKEGISNIFDLTDIKQAVVKVEPGHVVIEDNHAHGFSEPELVFTIFLTDKEDSHKMRGRKGRGLKELISAADKAIIETVGFTITFDEDGRTQEPNNRTSGTKIEVWSSLESWQGEHLNDAVSYLRKIIAPKGVELIINNILVPRPELDYQLDLYLLTTVIKEGVEKETGEHTEVDVYKLREGESKGWIHEMGIPIQEISTPFHIDVQQRIPMNDNRDQARYDWLKTLSQKIIIKRINAMSKDDLLQEWVVETSHSWAYDTDTSKTFAKKILGDKGVVKSENKKANDVVKESGFEVVDVENMPYNIKSLLENHGEDAEELARKISADVEEERVIPDEDQKNFASVVEWLAKKVINKDIQVLFFRKERDFTGALDIAKYCAEENQIKYNVLSDLDWDKPLSEEAIRTAVHEFAHEESPYHDRAFSTALENVAAKLVFVILHEHDEIMRRFENPSYLKGTTTIINCVDCGSKREIKVQDVHQVRRCKPCQREFKNAKRRKSK